MLEHRMRRVSYCGLVCLALAACSEDRAAFHDVGSAQADNALHARAVNDAPGADTPDAGKSSDSIGSPASVGSAPAGALMCGNSLCECNNGIDDDGDGRVDGSDVECTGAMDDDESSFATGIPGDNRDPKWQDCFFDGNSGAGDDRCRYPTECLTGKLSLSDKACAVTQACRDNCLPRTPNGCDCFGCCAVALPGGGEVNVMLTDTCSAEKIGDTAACPVCVPNGDCSAPPRHPEPQPAEPQPAEPQPAEPQPEQPGTPDAGEPALTCGGRTPCTEAGGCSSGQFCSQGCCLVVIQ